MDIKKKPIKNHILSQTTISLFLSHVNVLLHVYLDSFYNLKSKTEIYNSFSAKNILKMKPSKFFFRESTIQRLAAK